MQLIALHRVQGGILSLRISQILSFHFLVPLEGGTRTQLCHLQVRQVTRSLDSSGAGWSPAGLPGTWAVRLERKAGESHAGLKSRGKEFELWPVAVGTRRAC